MMSKHRLAQAIARVFSPTGRYGRLAVFCYHQVLDIPDAFRAGEPTSAEFSQDVDIISRVFNVLSFGEAIKGLTSGTLPKRAACITFDDGYANNHSLAAPILEKAGVPATFFIAGGAVDDGIMWNDLVIEAIAGSGGFPKFGDGNNCLVLPGKAANKAETVETLLSQLKYKPMSERLAISRQLYSDNVGSNRPRLMMTREMVGDLSARGFEIGGHTINHPILKELADEYACEEITSCRDWVKTVTGSAPVSFAYPNGRPGTDFDDVHRQMVADAGFRAAASTVWALATGDTNPYSVPRVGPWWRQGLSLESGLLRSYVRSYI